MHSCITGSIINVNVSVLSCDGSIGKYHIGYISHPFSSKRYQEYSGGFCDYFGRIIQICSKYIKHIAKSCCRIAHTVGNIDPAFLSFDRYSSRSVLGFCKCMINSLTDNLFFINDSVFNIITQSESDSSAASGLNKAIHRSCIERIFSIHKFRMKYHVSLLRRTESFQVFQTFPGFQVFCSHNTCFCNCS